MVHRTRRLSSAASLSLAIALAPQLSSFSFAFAPSTQTLLKRNTIASNYAASKLFYQEGSEQSTEPINTSSSSAPIQADLSNAPRINDSSYEQILNNPLSLPVLVDCYTDKCGPCKLIERSLKQTLPKYITPTTASTISSTNTTITHPRLSFAKWDTDTAKETSQQFMSLLRQHDMTFRKLPTLILFMDGKPMEMKSGMMSAAAVERFLEECLPSEEPREGKRRPKVGPDGALGISTRKMNR